MRSATSRSSSMRMDYWIAALLLAMLGGVAQAQSCFTTSIMAPSPFMGNHGEIFRQKGDTLHQIA
jgi:hypothetical protein